MALSVDLKGFPDVTGAVVADGLLSLHTLQQQRR
jgi:hypothetical protein